MDEWVSVPGVAVVLLVLVVIALIGWAIKLKRNLENETAQRLAADDANTAERGRLSGERDLAESRIWPFVTASYGYRADHAQVQLRVRNHGAGPATTISGELHAKEQDSVPFDLPDGLGPGISRDVMIDWPSRCNLRRIVIFYFDDKGVEYRWMHNLDRHPDEVNEEFASYFTLDRKEPSVVPEGRSSDQT